MVDFFIIFLLFSVSIILCFVFLVSFVFLFVCYLNELKSLNLKVKKDK